MQPNTNVIMWTFCKRRLQPAQLSVCMHSQITAVSPDKQGGKQKGRDLRGERAKAVMEDRKTENTERQGGEREVKLMEDGLNIRKRKL